MTPAGVLVLAKPPGWTSHDIVALVRSLIGVRRVGHGGTLDPLATGVLPILVGSATHFAVRLHEASKVYAARVRFGAETTTDDREGANTRTAALPQVSRDDLERTLDAFRGAVAQIPPRYAAVKVAGRRAYARARANEPMELAPRDVHIARLSVVGWEPPDLRLLVVCSSGTYVRSLARDIGRDLASAAHLAGLDRLAVGALEIVDGISPDDARAAGRDELRSWLRPVSDGLLSLDRRYLDDDADTIVAAGEPA